MDDEAKELLDDIRKWTKVLAQEKIQDQLADLSPEDKRIYELSTSDRTQQEVADAAGSTRKIVRNRHYSWFGQGLMEAKSVGRGNRYVRLDSLENFGIDVPEINSDDSE